MASGLRICDRCRALEKLLPGPPPPCKICGWPGPDRRAERSLAPKVREPDPIPQ